MSHDATLEFAAAADGELAIVSLLLMRLADHRMHMAGRAQRRHRFPSPPTANDGR